MSNICNRLSYLAHWAANDPACFHFASLLLQASAKNFISDARNENSEYSERISIDGLTEIALFLPRWQFYFYLFLTGSKNSSFCKKSVIFKLNYRIPNSI